MKKILNFLVLSGLLLCSSLLNAATVNFPTDQLVIQKIEEEGRKTMFWPKQPLFYAKMQTLLTLKEINRQFWNLEASYLDGWYGGQAPEEVSVIRVAPRTPYLFDTSDSTDYVSGTMGIYRTLTYGYHEILNLHFATLWYLHERELAVGDSFTIRSGFETCRYEILGINDENVDYSIKITSDSPYFGMQGVGFWNRKNGLVGQFYLDKLDNNYEFHFKFSSLLQEI